MEQTSGGWSSLWRDSWRGFWLDSVELPVVDEVTAMPTWGPTHDDQRIWAMVAFLQKLPELTPEY